MKPLYKPVILFLPLLALFVAYPFQTTQARQDIFTLTPTYDPLAEPPLPDHPTEYELGRNLYWHWCMTCHGDQGQGLTDEFRSIWPSDHQNCWGRGCHAGKEGDMGFPIPTVVPALVDEHRLSQFSSQQALTDYLEITHPPQSPGILKPEEYQAIAHFVFTMNGRLPVSTSSAGTPAPAPTPTMTPQEESTPAAFPISIMILLVVLFAFVLTRVRVLLHRRSTRV
ncbi:MAG TPA: hypothetical protein VHP14_25670 [Anaerolineales bacterium]|nr:hypothetical protein [Anaerolineales bacterium]